MEKSEKMSSGEAFSAFSKTFSRYMSSVQDGENPVLPKKSGDSAALKIHLKEKEQAWENAIVHNYKSFLEPNDSETSLDEENLLKAFRLFCAVKDASESNSSEDVKLQSFHISCPLTSRERYTSGGCFLYLRHWFLHEQNVQDYVPVLEYNKTLSAYELNFVTSGDFSLSAKEKAVRAVIDRHFYR